MTVRQLPATDRDRAIASLATFLKLYLPGKPLSVRIDAAKRERTSHQLNALFGVAYTSLMDQMGLMGEKERERMHADFCGLFWGWKEYSVLGQARKVPIRTTTTDENGQRSVISADEQWKFYFFIQRTAAEYGYDVPDPDPMYGVKER